jgi:hypothetical protein
VVPLERFGRAAYNQSPAALIRPPAPRGIFTMRLHTALAAAVIVSVLGIRGFAITYGQPDGTLHPNVGATYRLDTNSARSFLQAFVPLP